jgi:pyruvyltransferase
LSPSWQINLAQVYGRRGEYERAEELIEAAYTADDDVKEGYARLGWLKTEDKDWRGALGLMDRDFGAGRMSPNWQINLAQVYGRLGEYERAEELIEAAYAGDAQLSDGFARLGQLRLASGNRSAACHYMEWDRKLDRLTPECQLELARLYAKQPHELRRAMGLVEDAYAANVDLVDGYILVAKSCAEWDPREAVEIAARDHGRNRITPGGRISFAEWLASTGDYGAAHSLVSEAYRDDPEVKDGFSRLSLQKIKDGDWRAALDLVSMDHVGNRLTLERKLELLQIFGRGGMFDIALSTLESDRETFRFNSRRRVTSDVDPLVYYHHSYSFADEMVPELISRMVGREVRVVNGFTVRDIGERCLFTLGSIIHSAIRYSRDPAGKCVVWGSGAKSCRERIHHDFAGLDVRAVRGPLTRQCLLGLVGLDCPEIYGDPAILVAKYFPEFKPTQTRECLVIVQHNDEPYLISRPEIAKGFDVLYCQRVNRMPWRRVVDEIVRSRFVISSSLHALIIAEAFGIPARWWYREDLPSASFEGRMKYNDYYLSTGRNCDDYAETLEEAADLGGKEPPVRIDRERLVDAFPFELF